MSIVIYSIIPTEKFQKDMKYYEKNKKFSHIDEDVNSVVDELKKGNLIGDQISRITLQFRKQMCY